VIQQDLPYHKGPGVRKSGPKGPRKAKGPVLEAISSEIDRDPGQSSYSISDRVYEKTGVRISDSRIREIRHAREKSESRARYREGASKHLQP
jgi:hypothetical protein